MKLIIKIRWIFMLNIAMLILVNIGNISIILWYQSQQIFLRYLKNKHFNCFFIFSMKNKTNQKYVLQFLFC